MSYYTYGRIPEEIWPARREGALAQIQPRAYAAGGPAGGPAAAPLDALSDDPMFVRGPGTGRSDDIDARLSDGEYVIDAETVALLGDGSVEAGAAALDEMRVAIRKHKGRALAQGKFSPPAMSPLDYLMGEE